MLTNTIDLDQIPGYILPSALFVYDPFTGGPGKNGLKYVVEELIGSYR